MKTEVQFGIHKGSPIIPILSRINPIPSIDTSFFKTHSNVMVNTLCVCIYLLSSD